MKKSLFLSKHFTTIFFTAFFAISPFTTPASAHSYHYEVQVTNALQANDKKQLESLRISFLYDVAVSNAMLQDQNDLAKLGKSLISDLETLGYFTQVKLNGKVINTGRAINIKLEKVNVKSEDGAYDALKLHFTLALKTPVSIDKNSEIAFYHEDPTDAATLYYENAEHILLGYSLKDSCKTSVKEKGKFAEGEFPQIIRINCRS